MNRPEFTIVATPDGEGVTYACGCPCEPTARPNQDGSSGHEHCCCAKVHFVGVNAGMNLKAYLASRKAKRKTRTRMRIRRNDCPARGTETPVAWAFPLS